MIQPISIAPFFARLSRLFLCTCVPVILLTSSALVAGAVDSQDSQIFITGFNAYQKADYPAAIDKMNQVLTKHAETPLRDMALFWLARAHYKVGNQREAARYLSQFNKEYPDSPLKGTVEEELAALVPRFERGEQLANAAEQPAKPVAILDDAERKAAEQLAIARETAAKATREKVEAERIAAEQLAAAKAAEERAKAEKIEAAKVAEAKAAEQIALAKAAADKATKEKAAAEQLAAERLALAQAAEARAKTEKAEAARAAEIKATEQIAIAKAAADKAAKDKAVAERTAAEQLAAAKAAEQRANAEKVEAGRIAETKAAEQIALAKAAADKAAKDKAAAELLAAERLAKAQAAEERAKAERIEASRAAEAKAAQQIAAAKVVADKAIAERHAAEAAAVAKMNAIKAEADKAAAERTRAEKAAQDKLAAVTAAEKALREQLAAEKAARQKAESEKVAAEKAATEQIAAAKTDADRQVKTVIAQEQAVRNQAEADRRSAREKLLESSLAAEKAAREKAEDEKVAAEKAATAQQTAAQEALARLELERAAAKKAAQATVESATANEKLAREKAAADQAAATKAAAEQLVVAKAAVDRAEAALAKERNAREKAEAERHVLEKAAKAQPVVPVPQPTVVAIKPATPDLSAQLAAERTAREKAETALAQERIAREKAEAERLKAEKRNAELVAETTESSLEAAPGAKIAKLGKNSGKTAKAKGSNQLRDKAVAEYKRIIDRFPGSKAAASAATKLQELGIAYGASTSEPAGSTMTNTARVLAFEVGQYASLDLTSAAAATVAQASSRAQIPFELVNTGNGPDSFQLSTSAASELSPTFAAANAPVTAITSTPPLAPGERFKGLVTVTVPNKAIDGERLAFPIRAASQFTADVSQSRELRLVSSAPLLRAVIKADKNQLLPGETVSYKISLLNVGSAPARNLTFRLQHPAQLLPTSDLSGGRRESATLALLEPLTLQSGESRELTISFQLATDAPAQQELFIQGEFNNPTLARKDSFLAQAVKVQTLRGVTATAATSKIVVIPGQKVVIPIVVTNTGNIREDYSLAANIPATISYALYQDQNRDGLKQSGEPIINHVGPLAPREVAHVLLEINSSTTATDGNTQPLALSFVSDADRLKTARVDLTLTHTRPVLDLTVNGKIGKIRPGDASTIELDCVNRGTSLAKVVELESILPEQLEMIAADPAYTRGQNGRYLWSFEELGSGEKRSIKVTYRIKSGTAQGTSIQLQNLLRYQDLQGNRY